MIARIDVHITIFESGKYNQGNKSYTNFSLILHYSGDAGKEGHAEAIPSEPA